MSKAENERITAEAKSQNPDRSITELIRERDALNVRLVKLGQQTAEAEETACEAGRGKDPKSRAILEEFFEEAKHREYAVDHELANVCATILTQPPVSTDDLALKAQTVAFIASQDAIWDWEDFRDEIVAFAQQVSDWMTCEESVPAKN